MDNQCERENERERERERENEMDHQRERENEECSSNIQRIKDINKKKIDLCILHSVCSIMYHHILYITPYLFPGREDDEMKCDTFHV